jgi:hypothetical protein
MGGQAVLIAVGDGSYRIARLRDPAADPSSMPAYTAWPFPDAGGEPVAIAEGRLSDVAPAPPGLMLVVVCDSARTQCSVWQSELKDGQLSQWQTVALPAGFVPKGVALDSASSPRQVCVYGTGLLCRTDTWQVAIPSETELRIRSVAFGTQWSLAVGEHGRWFKRVRSDSGQLSAWRGQPAIGSAALTQASVAGAGGVITGQGVLQAALGEQKSAYDCSASTDLVALWLDAATPALAYAVTMAGSVLQHALVTAQRPTPYCAYQQLELPSSVLDTTIAPCGLAMNPRVLTDRILFGTNQCLS